MASVNTKVYLLDLGSLALDGHMLYWMHGPAGQIRFPVYGVLIDHRDGKFLFDTGFDKTFIDSVMPGNAIQSPLQTLPGQLDLVGLRPSDMTHVINSHYHVDHAGGNKLCTGAIMLCHKCELEAASNPAIYERPGYADLSFAPHLRNATDILGYADDLYTPRFETLTGDQEIAKGMHLFETPGHTRGHYSLMVELAGRRPMLFCGDACYSHRSMSETIIASAHVNVEESFQSIEKLRKLAQDHDAELFYAHDPEQWKQVRPMPACYS